jgi:hypothetical protein
VAYHWRPDFSWAEIAPDRPDVVIEEHAERYFVRPLRSAANESR